LTTISATTVLRSRNAARPEKVLTTLLLRYPRFVHAELMTHRVFSRNAASSRAIPTKKLIQDVIENPAIPIFWGKNQPGMQAREEHDALVFAPVPMAYGGKRLELEQNRGRTPEEAWLNARDLAVMSAKAFAEAGYHKQIVNRLLEPFSHITVLVSATEWENFLALRDHPDAEPHIRKLAQEIRKELEREDNIQTLQPSEWHLPFVTPTDPKEPADKLTGPELAKAIKLSVACCASTSYKTVDGFDMTGERAEKIFDKLVRSEPIHASPLEHVAQADWITPHSKAWAYPEQHRNFVGFRQYRAIFEVGNVEAE